jgi:Ca2+-binding RTX toxin-like protein
MAANSAQEQLMLELVNRARMDPAGEAARFGIGLGGISSTPKQVLAMNDRLVIAADKHSNWMLVNDQFSHEEPSSFPSGRTGLNPSDRMVAAGYTPITAAGENISFVASSAAINATTAIVDQHEDLFRSAGHRANILSNTFREIGVGQQIGKFTDDGSTFNASMVTQNFGLSGNKLFVTGVVYNDVVVNDNFFSVGEQTAGRVVSVPGVGDTTGAGGGYELGLTSGGVKVVSFNLSSGLVQLSVTVGARNIKIDLVNGHEVWTNADLAVVAGPITELHALGIEGVDLTGGAASERLTGNKGANVLDGGGGNDVLDGAAGSDLLRGRDGNDVYRLDTSGDIVDESTGSGADTVQSTVSVKLTDTAHVKGALESISLTGTASVVAWGNDSANVLTGNSGSNSIAGLAGNDVLNGGAGKDTMVGGSGQDFFTFNAPLAVNQADTVTDFNPVDDTFRLENAVMTGLGAATGALNTNLFFAGAAAHDANDRIVYNQATGVLNYDANGNAAGAVTHLATLTSKPTLAAADFVVI